MKIKKCYFVLLISYFGFSFSSFGQLTVDVGKDTTYCSDPGTSSISMGLKVKIKNGVAPYTLAWECVVVPYGILKPLTASDILNDSTLISPTIKNAIWIFTENKVKFILYVTDHLGNRVKDSINVDFSRCVWILGYQVIEINKGDSIWLDAGTPQGSVAAYHWDPSSGLSNPDSSATWCKPEVKTDYFLTSIYTSGCSCSNQIYEIRIITTNTDSKINSENNINPFQKGSRVYFNNNINQEALVSMFSLDGKLIHKCISNTNYIEASQLLPERGTYIVKISLNGNIGVCKYLKF
jgi:hypothetical protein